MHPPASGVGYRPAVLSTRAFNRILKIACTIAGFPGVDNIKIDPISEAIQYRTLDREKHFV